MRQLQQELADSLKKQSMSEASLDVVSRHCNNLKDETKDLKRKVSRRKSPMCMKLSCHKLIFNCVISIKSQRLFIESFL